MIAVYTALTGGKDRLLPPDWICEDVEYFCFTDDPVSVPTPWQPLPIEPHPRGSRMTARRPKILFHQTGIDADVLIWVDANFKITKGFREIVDNLRSDMYLFRHPRKVIGCTYTEAYICKSWGLDRPEVIDAQMQRYRAEGFPADYGLVESGIIIRRNTPVIRELCEAWWQELEEGSLRDQLSLMYCLWKMGLETGSEVFIDLDRTPRDGDYCLYCAHAR